MKTLTKVVTASAVTLATIAFGAGGAQAATPTPAGDGYKASTAYAEEQIKLQLQREPGGVRTGDNQLSYDGGNFVFVAAPAGPTAAAASRNAASSFATAATGACPSGWFCVWEYSNAQGNKRQWQSTGVNQAIAQPPEIHSYQNQRSAVTYLYSGSSASGQRTCVPAGGTNSSVGTPFNTSKTIYNSTAKGCA